MPERASLFEKPSSEGSPREQARFFQSFCLALVVLLLSSQIALADHDEYDEDYPQIIDWLDDDRGIIAWENVWTLDCENQFSGDMIWMGYIPPVEIEPEENNTNLTFPGVSIEKIGYGEFYLEGLNDYGELIGEIWHSIGEFDSWHPDTLENGFVYACYETPSSEYDDWFWEDNYCFDNIILDLDNPIGVLDILHTDIHNHSFLMLEGEYWHGIEINDKNLTQVTIPLEGGELSYYTVESDLNTTELEFIINQHTMEEIQLNSISNFSQLDTPPTWNSSIEDRIDWKIVICGIDLLIDEDDGDEDDEGEWNIEFGMAFNWVAIGCDGCGVDEDIEEINNQTITVEPKEPIQPKKNNDKFVDEFFSTPEGQQVLRYAPAAAGLSLVSLLGFAFSQAEALRYPFSSRLWLSIAFLVGATRQDERGDYQRGRIVGILTFNQGMHLSALIRALGMGNHQATHHLRVLQDEGIIWSRRIGREIRFYTADVPEHLTTEELPKPKIILTHDSVPHRILMFLSEMIGDGKTGANQKQIAKGIGASQQLVSYHIRALEEWGLVSKSRTAFGFQVEITSQGLEFLSGGDPPFEREDLTEEQLQLFDLIADSLIDESVQ